MDCWTLLLYAGAGFVAGRAVKGMAEVGFWGSVVRAVALICLTSLALSFYVLFDTAFSVGKE